jgi:hypothetical protein
MNQEVSILCSSGVALVEALDNVGTMTLGQIDFWLTFQPWHYWIATALHIPRDESPRAIHVPVRMRVATSPTFATGLEFVILD